MSEEKQLTPTKEDTQVDVSVVLVHYKTPGLLRQCIESIQKSKPDVRYEIIAVDNNSLDGTTTWLRDDFPDVVTIANDENLGFPKAVNQGVRASKGSYILLLNPDITVLPGSIDGLFQHMEQNSDLGLIGPKLLNPNGSLQMSCFSFYPTPRTVLYRRTFLGNSEKGQKIIKDFTMEGWDHSEERGVAWLLGSSMFVRRKAIEEIGLMDERFFMYMEDVDWCRRLWAADWKVHYYPKVEMVHYYARASADNKNAFMAFFNKQTRIHIVSAIKFFLKYSKTNGSTKKSKGESTKTA